MATSPGERMRELYAGEGSATTAGRKVARQRKRSMNRPKRHDSCGKLLTRRRAERSLKSQENEVAVEQAPLGPRRHRTSRNRRRRRHRLPGDGRRREGERPISRHGDGFPDHCRKLAGQPDTKFDSISNPDDLLVKSEPDATARSRGIRNLQTWFDFSCAAVHVRLSRKLVSGRWRS